MITHKAMLAAVHISVWTAIRCDYPLLSILKQDLRLAMIDLFRGQADHSPVCTVQLLKADM